MKKRVEVSPEQRDREAASFLSTAVEMANLIRAGGAASIELSWKERRRDPEALNLVQDTTSLKLTYDARVRTVEPWTVPEEPKRIFDDGLAEIRAKRAEAAR